MLANNTLSIFDATPCLRRLEVGFHNWEHLTPSTTLQLPWFQLTDVTFSGPTSPPFAMIFRVLGQCTKLINFATSFGNNDLSLTDSSDPATLILPHLRSLTLNILSVLVSFNRLLAPLVTPGLEAFYMRTSFGTLRWGQWPFLSLIKRSNCSLKTLSSPFLIEPGDVDSFLAALPSLVHLSLPATTIPPATIDSMIHRGMLPALETVAFTVDSCDAFLDLVEARRSGNNRGYKGFMKADVRALGYTGPSKDRYKKLKQEYLREGRSISVRRLTMRK